MLWELIERMEEAKAKQERYERPWPYDWPAPVTVEEVRKARAEAVDARAFARSEIERVEREAQLSREAFSELVDLACKIMDAADRAHDSRHDQDHDPR